MMPAPLIASLVTAFGAGVGAGAKPTDAGAAAGVLVAVAATPTTLIAPSDAGVLLTLGAHYARTTFLLGCFMSGVSFASVPRVVAAFEEHVPPLSAWTSRIFFASIGFAVPATELFSAEALGYGALLTAIAILTKVVTGCGIVKNAFFAHLFRFETDHLSRQAQDNHQETETKITLLLSAVCLNGTRSSQ